MEIFVNYEPNEWAKKFHISPIRHCSLAGGLGSGKSFAAVQELKALALENPNFTYLIGRKTMPSLRDTTMKTFFACMEDGLIKKHDKTHSVVTLINNSQFIFRPLDDMEKMKSLEIAGFFVDEANEIDGDTYNILKSRVRQKINGKEPSMYRTVIALNPGEEDHWIPQLFLHIKPNNHVMFQSTTMDNLKNLPDNYIEDLKSTFSPDMQQRVIYGLFGKVHRGRPIYAQFPRGSHVRPVEFDPKIALVRGFDFGFNHPAVVWMQLVGGQIRVLAELQGKNIYLQEFIRDEIIPYERSLFGRIPGKIIDFCDPRGSDESDKGKSSVQILNEHGIFPMHRRTWIEEGIKAVKHYLDTKTPDGDTNFLIHPRCKLLIEGFNGGYKRLDGEEKPDKDNIYDNVQDAMRYAITHCLQRAKIASLQMEQDKIKRFVSRNGSRIVEI